jgi:beta-galactosidase
MLRTSFFRTLLPVVVAVASAGSSACRAQSAPHIGPKPIDFDAGAPLTPPVSADFRGGASVNPVGHTLAVNARYLLLDGKPWLPVMGEFHYSRVPQSEWEEELLKMKAAGVQIVATYIFWIHQEEVQGQFDWSGQRDLRHFVQLCAKHGLYVYPRLGPWAHGEARNGGFPDWLLKLGPTRRNAPAYMAQVATYYAQIGAQLHGLLWKDGGPVIGVQIENEYSTQGPDAGVAYLMALKRLALENGIDVPLYSLTGWDNAVVPRGEFLPVYGGYPDAPWDASITSLPSSEVYTFRFRSRLSGDMGMMGGKASMSNEPSPLTPFFTAEMGGGIQDTYHRRPVISADDVAAMMPVMLGSGVNLYGTYMFQGGVNPEGKLSTLQESQATGYPTDVPVKSYDFQAPLSSYGIERSSLLKLKIYNYFLNDFGSLLAPMITAAPAIQPKDPADLSVPRLAVRSDGHSGFVFFNNYVRGTRMPPRPRLQLRIKLRDGELLLPRKPIDLPSGAYGIWPFHLDMDGVQLRYATAQLMTKFDTPTGAIYVFVRTPGVPAEFALEQAASLSIDPQASARAKVRGDIAYLRDTKTNLVSPITIRQHGGRTIRLLLLTRQQAENCWKVRIAGQDRLLLTSADLFADESHITLQSLGRRGFRISLFPGLDSGQRLTASAALRKAVVVDGLQAYKTELPPAGTSLTVNQVRPAGIAPHVSLGPAVSWRPHGVATAPADATFQAAAGAWGLRVAWPQRTDISNLFLTVNYQGDVARLFAEGRLLDDDFYNGEAWQVGLRRYRTGGAVPPLTLQILPLRRDAPIFLEPAARAALPHTSQVDRLNAIQLIPQYQLQVDTALTGSAP